MSPRARKSDPAPRADRPLGRDSAATEDHWDVLVSTMPLAPHLMRGEVPDRSPDLVRFDPKVPWYQKRGFCVGWTIAMLSNILQAIPPDADDASVPLPVELCNPIYSYDTSRIQAAKDGINLGNTPGPNGDGSIVSSALKSVVVDGFVRMGSYTTDEVNHRNGTIPGPEAMREGDEHLGAYALCGDLDHALEMLAAGYPVNLASPVTQGFMTANSKGYVTYSGGNVGGHSYRAMGYCKSENWLLLGNNWPQWGIRTPGDPVWSRTDGWWNMAYVKLTDAAKMFTARRIDTGACELGVVNKVRGWKPLIRRNW